MKILYENSELPQQVSLILGFFDGIHAGHRDVFKNTADAPRVVVTFSYSPIEYFKKDFKYIYSREYNYRLIEDLGIDYIFEQDFSNIVNISANDYLKTLIEKFSPVSITTGFNHTFGYNKVGNVNLLKENQGTYKYFCTPATKFGDDIVSSTLIKKMISKGELEIANKFLAKNFTIESTVIEGQKLGRELGFPTANMIYPDNIIKLPYGVYKARIFNRPAVMNWGIKPTIGGGETLEVHIPNYDIDLYGKKVQVELISKLRDEKKFVNIEELKSQIEKDVVECLK